MGDYNVNYDISEKSQNIIDYTNHIDSIGCTQKINKPTRICKTSSRIIDHIYTNASIDNQVSPFILGTNISDHCLLALKKIINRSKIN